MNEAGVATADLCRNNSISPASFYKYKAKFVGGWVEDAPVRARIRSLALDRRRFGYRRLHLLLAKLDLAMNQKRFRRLYREEGLSVRKRSGRNRAVGTRAAVRSIKTK